MAEVTDEVCIEHGNGYVVAQGKYLAIDVGAPRLSELADPRS